MQRRGRIAVTCAVTAVLAAPVVVDRDGFPLSTYPMYASARPPVVTLATAQAVTAAGDVVTLTPGIIGESDDPLIVAGELREAISAGRAEQRCAAIADRVGRSSAASDAVAVEVVTERHDVIARATGDDSLVRRTVHARCEVPS